MNSQCLIVSAGLCAALAGCAPLTPPAGSLPAGTVPVPSASPAAAPPAVLASPAPPAQVAGQWYSPPAEYPGICLHLAPDGTLAFAGGFAFFNPGHWRYDSAAGELRIELGGATPIPPALAAGQPGARGAAAPLRVETAQRALVYRIAPAAEAIDVAGFVFYRQLACPAAP